MKSSNLDIHHKNNADFCYYEKILSKDKIKSIMRIFGRDCFIARDERL